MRAALESRVTRGRVDLKERAEPLDLEEYLVLRESLASG